MSHFVHPFLVEFAPGNILLIQFSHSVLRLFCRILTWWKKSMRTVGRWSPRGNILNLHRYGRFSHFSVFWPFFFAFLLSVVIFYIVDHSPSLAWSSQGLIILQIWYALPLGLSSSSNSVQFLVRIWQVNMMAREGSSLTFFGNVACIFLISIVFSMDYSAFSKSWPIYLLFCSMPISTICFFSLPQPPFPLFFLLFFFLCHTF